MIPARRAPVETMDKDARIYIAGHTGLIGSACVRLLAGRGYANLITRTHAELDLTDQQAVEALFRDERPQHVLLAAALAGGIERNRSHPAEMIHVNLAIQTNVIDAARRHGVEGLVFLASGCSYPKHCDQPIRPDALLTGPLEETNEPFAVAKIAGVRMCQAYNAQYGTRFTSVVPATVYGPGDHFDENGHVVAALIARFHEAKAAGKGEVAVWGTGQPRREFLYVDDLAEALGLLMGRDEPECLINVGAGAAGELSIADLAGKIARVVGFVGRITFDTTRPDGMPQRLLESSRIRELGWSPATSLDDGLAQTYAWYCEHLPTG